MAEYNKVPEGALDFINKKKGGAAAPKGHPDNIAFNAMQNSTKSKADNIIPKKKDFDFETFIQKGDSLYQEYAKNTPQFHKKFPDIPMFDEAGGETPEFVQAWKDAGIDRVVQYTGLTPRQAHFDDLFNENKKGMHFSDESSFGLDVEIPYGKKPRYSSKGDLISPYKLYGMHREETKDMDTFEKMDFNRKFKGYVKSLSTDKPSNIQR